MKYSIVTSFSLKGYTEYANKFISTYERFNNPELDLYVYHEGTDLRNIDCKSVNLLQVTDCRMFVEKYKDNNIIKGTEKRPEDKWKDKCLRENYNFRFDADKFCRKIFAIRHAANTIKEGKLFWIDADVIFFSTMTTLLLDSVLPDNYAISYLKRWDHYHSECGFVGYNLEDPKCIEFINSFSDMYLSGGFLKYKEWHDSYLFDQLRNSMGVKSFPIHSTNMHQVFNTSDLGKYMMHLKGDRKKVGVGY